MVHDFDQDKVHCHQGTAYDIGIGGTVCSWIVHSGKLKGDSALFYQTICLPFEQH